MDSPKVEPVKKATEHMPASSQLNYRPKVLIVDDQPQSVETLSRLLESIYAVTNALSGEEALELASGQTFDIILLDVNLPGISGYDVCERIASSKCNAETPVIFVSGCASIDSEVRGLQKGAVDYVLKPVTITPLMFKIENHLKSVRYRRDLEISQGLDHLTCIANRRTFDFYLEREIERARRKNGFISLIMLDVDWFKSFNDLYGHLAGDRCLRVLAQVMTNCCVRSSDLCARYGGEEFAIVLPDTRYDGAVELSRRLGNEFRRVAIPHERSKYGHVTASMGIAAVQVDERTTPKCLIQLADSALYRAKASGKAKFISCVSAGHAHY